MADAASNSARTGSGSGDGAVAIAWEPETPFASAPIIPPGPAQALRGNGARSTIESPFSAEYIGDDVRPGPQAEAFAALVGELHDEAFMEAVEDLVDDASAVLEEGFSGEIGDPVRERHAMERTLHEYLQPLERASTDMLDRMIAGLSEKDVTLLPEAELDALLERHGPPESDLAPAFEEFVGKLFNKAKRAVKGAISVAKKVAGAVAAPHLLILDRLKGLVRPLLERVLRFAIDKLPVALRPLAGQLAQRFLGVKVGEVGEAAAGNGAPLEGFTAEARRDAAAADPGSIAEELDTRLAGYLVAGESFERRAAIEDLTYARAAQPFDAMQALEQGRRDFAREVVQLEDGEDPTPQVEQFVPAILGALKLGISVIGRPRVVKFLAGLVAKLISKYVGPQQAVALSSALVDAGLRVVSLEAPEDEAQPAGDALAATVEETVTRLVQTAPPGAWESEALLEAYVHEAFQHSAAAHFPDPLIRDELHETSDASGAWVPLPANGPRKRYKKYSRVLDVSLTPQLAGALRTFGGVTLAGFLKDRLGVRVERPIRARVHLYEAIAGTRLSLVALHERQVAGLGSARRQAWALFHPLTPEAAGLLFKEPGLGRPVPPEFLVRRRVSAVGQRFYFLEIPGARVRLAPRRAGRASRPARSTQLRVVLDFVKRELRVSLYYGEADAQEITRKLRQKLPIPVLLKALKAAHDAQLAAVFSGTPSGAVRIVHEATPVEELAAPLVGSVLRLVGGRLSELVVTSLLDALKRELETRYDRFVGEFERATQADEDGVTMTVIFEAPPVLEQLRKLLKPGGALAPSAALAALGRQAATSFRVDLQPGFSPS